MDLAAQNNFPCAGDRRPPSSDAAGDIRGQLRRVLSSRLFSKSVQAGHLLTFLVEEALKPNGADLRTNFKEYSIAVHAFGRPVSFDPTLDNIVRVEVRRVRSKLESYYAEEGASDPILISIPKGTYVPAFQTRAESDFDLSGRTISHYELVRRRCTNRWQTTYDANCLHLHRSVIVIIPTRLALENEGRQHSLFEGTRGGGVIHPNVAAVHDVEATNGQLIIAAAGLPGHSLRELVEQGTLSNGVALRFAHELAAAIGSGHQTGTFHGNLNPDSVTFDHEPPHAHILPFGISPLVDIEHPAFQGFRPPEWSEHYDSDLRSDVWSFGALVWLACYGSAPPPDAEAPARDTVPPRLTKILTRCLQPNPSLRYANASEILQDIVLISPPSAQGEELPRPRPGHGTTIWVTAVLLAALIIAIITSIRLHRRPAGVTSSHVIVLPLANISGDRENEPYCQAAAELLAAKLGRVPGIYLVSSRSLGEVTGEHASKALLQRLGVDYVVDGSLVKTESRFHATMRLMNVAEGGYQWTDSHSGPWTDVSARIEELADGAALAMGLVVQRAEASSPPSADVSAHDLWLKGRFAATEYWNTLEPQRFEDAERRLLRALELQPSYVDAMADLGQLYLSAAYPPKGNQKDLLEKAEKYAQGAVTLEPENARAQTVLGGVYTDTGRPRMAMPHLLRAAQLSPSDPNPHNALSLAYEAMGFWESALYEREAAIERDPLLRGIERGKVMLLVRLGRVDEALKIAELFGAGSAAWGTMVARIHLLTGKPKLAEAVLTRTNTHDSADLSTSPEILMALARAAQGQPEIARIAVKKLRTSERQRGVYFAMLCALAGEKDSLVNEIANHAYARNYRWVISEPLLRPYRDYPPYQKLVHDLHEEWERNIDQFRASLRVQPPKLPSPEQYLTQQ